MKGVLRTMFLNGLNLVAAAVLAVAGAGGLANHGRAVEPQAKDDKKADKPKEDKDALQGTWKVVRVEEGGQSKEDEDIRMTFSGDEFSIKRGGQIAFKGKFKIDPSKKPKTIDLEITEDIKDEFKGKTGLGIYALEGDTLKLCASHPGETERPEEFSAPTGAERLFLTCKREKP